MEPMLEAIKKMYLYYQNQNVNIFKDGISVPGLTLKYMFQDLPSYFTIICVYIYFISLPKISLDTVMDF